MVVPGVVFLIVFRYIPMAGMTIAFQKYSVFKGVLHSPWVGMHNFQQLLSAPNFAQVFANTLILGLLNVSVLFPVPLVLALMINELRSSIINKSVQTALYLPYFMSWVIIASITFNVFSLHGLWNAVTGWFGVQPTLIMQEDRYFRLIYVLTALWRNAGWNTIIFMAALSALDPQLYESAVVDGASRVRQMFSITLPLLIPTAVVLFLLQLGKFLELGFEHVYTLLTPMTYSVGDIIDTYVYRVGVLQARYSFATAGGLFQAVIAFILVYVFNRLAKRFTESGGIW